MSKSKTPMELQYDSLKAKHPDKILLFRLGDFYEVFDDDAITASNILNIAMTKRHSRPMCGFPHHALDQYAYKLVEAGHKVALCEQVESVSEAKGIVKRDVVSILTKGTWSENPLLDHSSNSFLAVISFKNNILSIIFADISTGEIIIRSNEDDNHIAFLKDELTRYMPVETLCPQTLLDYIPIKEELKIHQDTLRILPVEFFQENELYNDYKQTHLSFFNSCTEASDCAIRGLCAYLQENYISKESIQHLRFPLEYHISDTLLMNEDTLKHLELALNARDFSNKGTLFSVLNKTKTTPAARKLKRLLLSPSAKLSEIHRQQKRTEYFYKLQIPTKGLSDLLKGISDLERLTARLITGKLLPREILALADALQRAEKIRDFLLPAEEFQDYLAGLKSQKNVIEKILLSISPECTNTFDGTVLLKNVNKELDDLKEILNNSKNFLIKLQTEERLHTGIHNLKIAYNKIYGYYIEVTKASAHKIPQHYVRKQSLVNAERYTIPELEDFEKKILRAEESVIRLEKEIYEHLIQDLQESYHELIPWSEFITEVDLRLSLATVAKENHYIKAEVTNNFEWLIEEGRHPVIEQTLKKDTFVANKTNINQKDSRILIVTGPNMAGKSTYLRQNALFAVMAQIGSYVPAKKAVLGLIDKIFTRIGASDDLGSGRSTFFVEMQEAAKIVTNTTPRSLIIMDELGRGTSTQDGLALSWAILEHFLLQPKKKGKVLFSTHYYELTELANLNGIANLSMAVKESGGKPVFLRKVVEGKASKSYGIHVAEMAGMELSIVKRATEILSDLETGVFFKEKPIKSESLELFSIADEQTEQKDIVFNMIKNIDPNKLTPFDALQIIFELKDQIK